MHLTWFRCCRWRLAAQDYALYKVCSHRPGTSPATARWRVSRLSLGCAAWGDLIVFASGPLLQRFADESELAEGTQGHVLKPHVPPKGVVTTPHSPSPFNSPHTRVSSPFQTLGTHANEKCEPGKGRMGEDVRRCLKSGLSVGARDRKTGQLIGLRVSNLLDREKPFKSTQPCNEFVSRFFFFSFFLALYGLRFAIYWHWNFVCLFVSSSYNLFYINLRSIIFRCFPIFFVILIMNVL